MLGKNRSTMKKCPRCNTSLSKAGKTRLNFRLAVLGGDPFGCLIWPGSYQFIILCFGFVLSILVANTSLYLAFYGVLLPSLVIMFIILGGEHPLFKCHSCKQMYAGTRLALYSRDDNTYL